MPLIVRWPGVVRGGSVNTDLVQNLDFAETFLDIAGVPVPPDMQGRSLVPLLRGHTPANWRQSIYYHYYEFPGWHDVRRHEGVRTDRYKLIHYYDIGEWELFDLWRDPYELRSAYENPLYADVVKELKAELVRLRKLYKVDAFEEPPPPPDPKKVALKLVLHFDASRVDGKTVPDVSGNGHDGVRANVNIVDGLHGKAFELGGDGQIKIAPFPDSLDPTYRPFTVGAWCKPATADGVIIANGEQCFGYSLYLQGGRPCFDLQAGQNRFLLCGPREVPANQWVHLAATVDADARITLWMDGAPVARIVDGFHVNSRPLDGFSVGADIGSPAGPYTAPMPFTGLIEDVRLYWGVLDEDTLKQWAGR